MNFNFNFNAREHEPQQGRSAHPVGNKIPVTITNRQIVPTKSQDGGMLVITFTSSEGEIDMRYNLWNPNQQAVDIANKQLSALCHATGVFNVSGGQGGIAPELQNARLLIDVGNQKQSEEDAKAGKTPYVEVKKIYDINGNEPGKAANGPQSGGAPFQQGAQNNAPAANSGPANGAAPWGQPQQQAPAQAQQPWQQGPQGGAPPWAQR